MRYEQVVDKIIQENGVDHDETPLPAVQRRVYSNDV